MNSRTLLVSIVLVAFLAQALGHSYLTNPTSRSNQKDSTTGCRGPACLGPCDRPKSSSSRAPIVAARGSAISVEWPRNNHAGGFIRLAWAKTTDSDSHAAFDAGVQQISCHEVGGCKSDDPRDLNGGDTAPADGSRQPCKTTINIPNHLTDGKWTLQWSWFGGAFELGDYYSCVDYTISGGALSNSAAVAVFKGGDVSYPGQAKCKYFNTDRLHRCVNEPCDNPVKRGEQSGPAFGFSGSSAPATQAPATQAPATQAPATAAPSTPRPSTAAPTPKPSTAAPATQPPAENPGGACTLGHQRCSTSNTFQICGWASRTETGWSVAQSCPSGLGCHVVQGNYIWCY